jgi:hypothetical protein
MRLTWLALAVLLVGCEDDDDKNMNMAMAAMRAATLVPTEEVPPATASTGTGTSSVTINAERTQIQVSVTYSGLTTPTNMAHIHKAAVGVAGPIIFDLSTAQFTSPLSKTLTAADLKPNMGTFAENLDAILNGGTYVNVHTTMYPTGEIRGQLK